jgi:cellulose synthase/poly-beta-1,6-N-acetylglucosamine synthase-like glycosyltransferase
MKKKNDFIEIESNFKRSRVKVDLANLPRDPSLRKKYEKKKIIKKIMPPMDEIPGSATVFSFFFLFSLSFLFFSFLFSLLFSSLSFLLFLFFFFSSLFLTLTLAVSKWGGEKLVPFILVYTCNLWDICPTYIKLQLHLLMTSV